MQSPYTNIGSRMARAEELSDVQCGTVIGCHLSNKSVGLITQHPCPTSLMLLWLNGSKSPQQCSSIQWKAFQEKWRLLQQQSRNQLHINAHYFGMGCSTRSCAHDKKYVDLTLLYFYNVFNIVRLTMVSEIIDTLDIDE